MVFGCRPMIRSAPSGSVNLSLAQLIAGLQGIYGASLVGLWIGEEISADSNNSLIQWNANIGNTLTIYSSAYKRVLWNGKFAMQNTGSIQSGFLSGSANSTVKDMVCVAHIGALPFGSTPEVFMNNGSYTLFGTPGSNYLQTATGDPYVDGVLDAPCTLGTHILESSYSSGSSNLIYVYGDCITSLCYALSSVQDSTQRTAANLLLSKYYKIGLSAAEKLVADLVTLYGTSLNGLWLGEDTVCDPSSNVLLLPARVGYKMSNTTSNYFKRVSFLDKNSFDNPDNETTNPKSLVTTLASAQYTAVSLANINSGNLPFSGYPRLLANTTTGILGYSGTSQLHTASMTTYVNGIRTALVGTGVSIFESGYTSSTSEKAIYFGKDSDGTWRDEICMGYTLSNLQTNLKRYEALVKIKDYYGLTVTAEETLALNLLRIYDTSLVGLYLGEDIKIDGSNNVTSWPGRVGEPLGPSGGTWGITTDFGNKRCLYSSSVSGKKMYAVSSFVVKDAILVSALPCVSSNQYMCLAAPGGTDSWLIRNSTNNSWFTSEGYTHYQDGLNTDNWYTRSPTVIEGYKSTASATGICIGGSWDSPARSWDKPIGCAILLSSVQSAGNRTSCFQALQSYFTGITSLV